MDWSSIIIGIGSAGGALGLNEVVRIIVNKWANKKKDAVDVQDDLADLEAKDIVNREKTFAMLSQINDKLIEEMADLTKKLIAARSQMAEVINYKITLTMENADFKSQNEMLKKENDELRKNLNELKEKLAKMETQIKELQKKI
jgi:chromosome segregation ATPase